jgi:predicted MFS family arabinose efflux permease
MIKKALNTPIQISNRSLLFQSDFFLLWLGQSISQLGDGLNKIALLWFVYKLTGKASNMAVIGILQTIPIFFVSLLAGPYLDKLNKKHVMIFIDLVRFILVSSIPFLYFCGYLNFITLCSLVLSVACFSVLFGPALTSTIPFIVTENRYKEANGLMQSTGQLGLIFGPALAGMLIPILSAPNILYIDAITFFISALCIIPLRYQNNKSDSSIKLKNLLNEVKTGINFIFRNKTILNTLFLIFMFNFFITSLPIIYSFLSKNILEDGSKGLGFLMSGFGVGALIASLVNGYIKIKVNNKKIILGLLIILGVSFISISKLFFLRYSLLISVIIGMCASSISILYVTLLQLETPKDILSRTFTSFAMLVHSATILGMFFTGYMLDFKGVIYTMFLYGAILVSVILVILIKLEFDNKFIDIKYLSGSFNVKFFKLLSHIKNNAVLFFKNTIDFLNKHGYEIYIVESNYTQSKSDNIWLNMKVKIKEFLILNPTQYSLQDKSLSIKRSQNMHEADVIGWVLLGSYMVFIIAMCL